MTSGYHFSLANLAWRFTPSGRLLVTNRLGILRERFNNDNREKLPLASGNYGEWVWNANGAWMWHGENALDFGGSVRRIRDDGFSARYQFNPFAVRRIEDFRGTGLRAGAFVQQSWRMAGGRIRPALGLRLDRDSVNEVRSLSGQGSIAFLLRPSTRIHLGWGQYVQHPDLQWLYSRVGNRGLLPERANHFLVALEKRLGERTRLRMEFYHRQDRDLLFRSFYEPRLIGGQIFNPPTDPPMGNALRGYARGMEIFLQRRSANRLSGWVSYALGYATLRDPAAGISFPSDQDQRHTVNVYLSYRLRPTVNLSVKSLYGSGFPMPGFYRREDAQYFLSETRNSLRMDSYQRADFRINKAHTFKHGKITLYAEIINFLNSRNRRFGAFNGYNPTTGQVAFTLMKMFPVLPSAGLVLDL
jgi:outer membrane cobalamin receptor